MLKLHSVYKVSEGTAREGRFGAMDTPLEPTSLFVIFQQLGQVRAQKKFFEDREAHLLVLAELGFEQLNKKKNGSKIQ